MDNYEKAVALWRKWQVRTQADIDHRLDSFRILFAYNSGKIENSEITYNDTHEVFENGRVLNYTGQPRTLFELTNQKLCYEFLKPKLASREPLSIALVKEIHAVLTSGTYDERRFVEQGERPGEFKKHDYVTGIEEVGSLPEDVEADLAELLDELAEYKDKDPLKVAAYFHTRFEYIHPFADGNGRVGRTLLNYYLMTHDHPPLVIYDEDKNAYYDALHAYDVAEELEPMAAFLREQTQRTWEKALQRQQQRTDKDAR
jgi:Fic family protein